MSDKLQFVVTHPTRPSPTRSLDPLLHQTELLRLAILHGGWIPQRESIHQKETDHTDTENRRQQKHSQRVMTLHLRHFPEHQQHPREDEDKIGNVLVSECHVMPRRTEAPTLETRKLFCRSAAVLGRPCRTYPNGLSWQASVCNPSRYCREHFT